MVLQYSSIDVQGFQLSSDEFDFLKTVIGNINEYPVDGLKIKFVKACKDYESLAWCRLQGVPLMTYCKAKDPRSLMLQMQRKLIKDCKKMRRRTSLSAKAINNNIINEEKMSLTG